MPPATAGILSTGTEILQGLYPDTNAQWLSGRLGALGIEVVRHTAAPDRAEEMAGALRSLAERCDLIIATGGLGPTEDDLTRQAICEVFGGDLAFDARAWEMIEERFARRGAPVPASNRVQCLIPSGARTLLNEWGTAPGFILDATQAPDAPRVWLACLPGPPRENRPMFEKYVEAELAKRFGGGLRSEVRVLHTFGISESALNDRLRPIFEELRADAYRTIAFLAGQARVDVRLSAKAASQEELDQLLDPLVERVRQCVPNGCIYGMDEATLESVVGDAMRRAGLRLAVAESCTGGLVAKRLTDVAGSSEFFTEGWVTYTNEAKQARLGVRSSTINLDGAVSERTAREMALGALERSGADVAVALTGIAGPGGGSEEKPVGLVWYGLAWRPDALERAWGKGAAQPARARYDRGALSAVFRTCFASDREMVRLYASHRALDLVRRLVLRLELELP